MADNGRHQNIVCEQVHPHNELHLYSNKFSKTDKPINVSNPGLLHRKLKPGMTVSESPALLGGVPPPGFRALSVHP